MSEVTIFKNLFLESLPPLAGMGELLFPRLGEFGEPGSFPIID